MNRDRAIDLLKFLAVVLVVNSHMDVCYLDAYKSLATGGSLGDALFFFCSGYTLFLGRNLGFVCWYKRRLARILPSVIVCVLGYSCFYGDGWYTEVGGYNAMPRQSKWVLTDKGQQICRAGNSSCKRVCHQSVKG